MNRRSFLAGCGGAAMSARAAAGRPNILFLFCDDWGRYASAYRDPRRPGINDVVRTPHIDRVAREGALFTNAFMATPSCTPSRAAVATGCYSWRTGRAANLRGGAWEGQRDPGTDLPGFGRALEKEGYLVRSSYKTLSPAWLGGKSYGRREFLRFSQYVSQAGSSAEIARRREQYVDQARQGIRAVLKERATGQPFFYVFGPINAHRPWIRQSGTKLWGIDPEALKGKLPAFLPDIPLVRQDVADYLGEVQALDLLAGCFLEELEKSGELDRTLIALAGDNGMGGMPRGKCNLYDFGVAAPLMIRWSGRAKGGRTVDGFVNLMDLAPTFLEAAGIGRPEGMDGRSLVPLLASGARDAARDFVVTSRERHVPTARQGRLPYPSRAIRTRDYLYIRNFKPERSPMGDPAGPDESFSYETLTSELATYTDMDASPSKAWVIQNRRNAPRYFELAFGRRPAEELYDLRKDPDQVRNVVGEAAYGAEKTHLSERLMKVLRATHDPRLEDAFDRVPYVEA